MTITISGPDTTITWAQLISPGGPIVCPVVGAIIRLPVEFTGEKKDPPKSVDITNTSDGDQTIIYTNKHGTAGRSVVLPKKKHRRFMADKPDNRLIRWYLGTEFNNKKGLQAGLERSLSNVVSSSLGSTDVLIQPEPGSALAKLAETANLLVLPTGKPIVFGDSGLGLLEFEDGDPDVSGDFGNILMRGVPFRSEEGFVIHSTTIEIAAPRSVSINFSFEGRGLGPMVLFRATGGVNPPPAASVSVVLPNPTTLLYGQEVYFTRPDALTGLDVTIDGGASFGGGTNAARDTATVNAGFVGRFWTDGTVWYAVSGVSLV